MQNNYSRAVDFLEEVTRSFMEATQMNQMDLPNIETGIEYSLKILKTHQDYDGRFPIS